jgi:hypothetical protein
MSRADRYKIDVPHDRERGLRRSARGVRLSSLAIKLEGHERFRADDPGVVARLDHVCIARSDLDFRAVIMADLQLSRHNCPDVVRLAALGTRYRFDAFRPASPWLHRHARRFHRTEVYDLNDCLIGGSNARQVPRNSSCRLQPCSLPYRCRFSIPYSMSFITGSRRTQWA